jgi:ubiquitin C-terminal hydrolase
MDLTKYYIYGRTGIANMGNTCFLNSCMQVINHTYELNELLSSSGFNKLLKIDTDDTKLMSEWIDLHKVMWSGNGTVMPTKFVHNVHMIAKKKGVELFTGFAQNDMPEFLLFIIDCMHNSISRCVNMNISGTPMNNKDIMATKCYNMLKTVYSKEYSEIMNLFYGIYVSEIISKDLTTYHAMKPEHFFILDLPIFNNDHPFNNIYECLNHYTQSETLSGDNSWFNEKTKQKEEVVKQISFWSFPKIFVVVLKRFTPDGQRKITSKVDFPVNNLDLSAYVKGYNQSSYVYDLYGICNHFGGTTGGHYTAFVKNAKNEWIHYNDDLIEDIKQESDLITPNAYCLFYRKK